MRQHQTTARCHPRRYSLTAPDRIVATRGINKAKLLPAYFYRKGQFKIQRAPHPKHCCTTCCTTHHHLSEASLSPRTWPSIWKQARVVAIYKKNSRADPKFFRPISLLSVVGKVFESPIASKMTCFLEAYHLLSPKQFDFGKGKSAADLLLLQSATWNKALYSGTEVFVVALDVAAAFDRVRHQGITTKLWCVMICCWRTTFTPEPSTR